MTSKTESLRVAVELKTFIDKAIKNRVGRRKEDKVMSRPEMQRHVVNYFKLNNDRYLELMDMVKNDNA